MRRLSDEQRRVLKRLRRSPATPEKCGCRVTTFVALAERKLIYVATSFASVGWPRTSARAEITEAGLTALKKPRSASDVRRG